MKEEVFTLVVPEFDDECPTIPEGATRWEAQEINRVWRNALRFLNDLVAYSTEYSTQVGCGLAVGSPYFGQRLEQAVFAMGEYYSRMEGVRHRLAVQNDFKDNAEQVAQYTEENNA